MSARADELVRTLGLVPHPEGGHYAEVFRSAVRVQTARGERSALTTIDFLLRAGECSAWHRVRSDEVWHLLEGGPLVLWLLPPDLSRVDRVELARVRRHVVPADWWQAAEPAGEFAYVGATVGPGFEFADFSFGRDDAALRAALPDELNRLL
ncbi:MAG: cupin domain-containing protein [Rubrivivax sp.]